MSLRMERPDQDEEEWKEEPKCVKPGDTWTEPRSALRCVLNLKSDIHCFLSSIGSLYPVYRDINLEKADQRGSETRSTTYSDQDEEEWEEEPESGRAGGTWTGSHSVLRRVFHMKSLVDFFLSSIHHGIDIQRAAQTGPRSALRKPHALRSSIPPLVEENLSPAADDIDNDITDQHRSETTESSAWGDGPFILMILASWMGRERPTAHRKDDCDFPGQPTTSNSDTQRRKSAPECVCNVFGTWSAAAVWIMMALTVATSSLAGAECIGTEVKLDKGEAILRCPLPVNTSATRHSIIVKHFPTSGSADTVMFCYWPTEEADKPICGSSDGFSLVGQLTDQVVAKVPVSRLMDSGDYKCQLGDHKDFIPCHIHRFSDNEKGAAVVPTPVVSSTAANRRTPGQNPLIRKAPPCVGQSGSVALTAAVLVLQVIIFILLVVDFLYLQTKKNLQGKGGCMKVGWMAWRPWKSSEKSSVRSEAEPMNRPEV